MPTTDLTRHAKQSTLRLTTTGRKSGEPRAVKVWFVLMDAQRIAVQHVRGSDANWYRNLAKNPNVEVDLGGGLLRARAIVVHDRAEINRILKRIRGKYLVAWLLQAFGTRNAVAATIELLEQPSRAT